MKEFYLPIPKPEAFRKDRRSYEKPQLQELLDCDFTEPTRLTLLEPLVPEKSLISPDGVLPKDLKRQPEKIVPMSIGEMLVWEPRGFLKYVWNLDSKTITIDPTYHALSQSGTQEEKKHSYHTMTSFLTEPNTAEYLAEAFHVPTKSFRTRPPLKIIADSKPATTGERERYEKFIFKAPSTSLYFILANEHVPIASIGFNQFADGVEIQYVQGVNSKKIGTDSAKDLIRLGGWSEKLVSLTERYAEHQGLKYSMVLPADQNIWVNPVSFPLEKAKKIYDEMAEKRGYHYNKKLKRLIKAL